MKGELLEDGGIASP